MARRNAVPAAPPRVQTPEVQARRMGRSRTLLLLAVVLGLVTLAYANHFQNSFHFDDFHTIAQNPYIRSLANIPRFFSDPDTSSVLPPNRTFRPLLFCTLAIDYALGHSLQP